MKNKLYIKEFDKHATVKAGDLRVGNWLWFKRDTYSDRHNKIRDNWFQVAYISDTVIGLDIGFEATQRFETEPIWSPKFEELKCIILTPEILEACGFQKYGEEKLFWKDRNVNLIQGYNSQFFLMVSHYGKPYEYLHQLQNLYYALTGQELTVNFPVPAG